MEYVLYGKVNEKQPIRIDNSDDLPFLIDQAEYFLVKASRYDSCFIKDANKKEIWWSDIEMVSNKLPAITAEDNNEQD